MALPPDEPNDEERLEELPGDYDTPVSPPDDEFVSIADDEDGSLKRRALDSTHPDTDTDIENEDVYGEGLSAAAGVAEPNAGDAVIGYDKSRDKRITEKYKEDSKMATTKQRAKPGAQGGGEFYRIELRPKSEFVIFRYHDVGDKGHLERLAGQRPSGSWATEAWLVSKDDAHIEGGKLVPDSADAKDLLGKLGSEPVHIKGDIFKAKDRRNVPERDKPTPAQQKARMENMKKAQAARRVVL